MLPTTQKDFLPDPEERNAEELKRTESFSVKRKRHSSLSLRTVRLVKTLVVLVIAILALVVLAKVLGGLVVSFLSQPSYEAVQQVVMLHGGC